MRSPGTPFAAHDLDDLEVQSIMPASQPNQTPRQPEDVSHIVFPKPGKPYSRTRAKIDRLMKEIDEHFKDHPPPPNLPGFARRAPGRKSEPLQ